MNLFTELIGLTYVCGRCSDVGRISHELCWVGKWHIYGNNFEVGTFPARFMVLEFIDSFCVAIVLSNCPLSATRSIITIMNSSLKKSIKHSHTPFSTHAMSSFTWLECLPLFGSPTPSVGYFNKDISCTRGYSALDAYFFGYPTDS